MKRQYKILALLAILVIAALLMGAVPQARSAATYGWIVAKKVTVQNATDLLGTLSADGAVDFSSTLAVTGATALDGGLTMDTNKFTVADTSGNTVIAGTLAANGGLSVDSTAFTVADTSGNTTIAGTLKVAGATNMLVPVITQTTSYTLTTAMSGAFVDNLGAGAAVTFTLPAAGSGLNFCFYTSSAQNLVIDPAGTNQVLHLTNAGGDSLTNSTVGDSLCLISTGGSNWVPIEQEGTWTDTN